MNSNNLIPISDFIEAARRQGAAFGGGDPKIHLAYLTRLGILPQSTKRKISGKITGCYPEEAISTLLKFEHLKASGMTYSQIAKTLATSSTSDTKKLELVDTGNKFSPPSSLVNHDVPTLTINRLGTNPAFLYLIIGVLVGFLISTLNTQGLAQLHNQALLGTSQSGNQANQVTSVNPTPQSVGSVYVLTLPKQNLDKLNKTNINYLINN